MSTFAKSLQKNYDSHPAFPCDNPFSLTDCRKDFNQFNSEYLSISIWPAADNNLQENSFANAEKCLSTLFNCLLKQAHDQHEKCFLQELHSEILRTLHSDLVLFKKLLVLDFWTRVMFRKHKKHLEDLRTKRFFFGRLSSGAVKKVLNLGSQ